MEELGYVVVHDSTGSGTHFPLSDYAEIKKAIVDEADWYAGPDRYGDEAMIRIEAIVAVVQVTTQGSRRYHEVEAHFEQIAKSYEQKEWES